MFRNGTMAMTTNNFSGYEHFLCSLSSLLSISIEIKGLTGDSLVSTLGICCNQKGVELHKCREVHWNFCKEVIRLRKTLTRTCRHGLMMVGVPLPGAVGTAGVMLAYYQPDPHRETGEISRFLEEIGALITGRIVSEIEIDSLAQELSVRYEELNLIYDTGKKLGEIGKVDQTIHFIVEKTLETFDTEVALASIPSKDLFDVIALDPEDAPIVPDNSEPMALIDRHLLQRVTFADIDPPHVVITDVSKDPDLGRKFPDPFSLLAVPVKIAGNVVGYLGIAHSDRKRLFSTGDVRLLSSLAEQISIVATNDELYQNLKNFLLSVIQTLVSSIEAKDTYTKGHSERVRNLSLMIAEALGFSQEEKEILSWAALLHDIGKLGVPEGILTKPGKLTEEEKVIIQDHPERGYRILLPIEQLQDSLSGIRFHHERLDGSGYPLGLKGEEIPIQARIIGVADTYDAMTSRRSYRDKLRDDVTLAELVRVKGSQLDPEIVDLFVDMIKSTPPKATIPSEDVLQS